MLVAEFPNPISAGREALESARCLPCDLKAERPQKLSERQILPQVRDLDTLRIPYLHVIFGSSGPCTVKTFTNTCED